MPQSYTEYIESVWKNAEHPLEDLWKWAKSPNDPARREKRWDALADWAGRKKRQAEPNSDVRKKWAKIQAEYEAREKANEDKDDDVPANENGWYPRAWRVQVAQPLSWSDKGEPKGVLHTTEGYGLPTYSGSAPHFTIDPSSGEVWQHVSINGGAYSLENDSGGVETNRDNVIQIEIIGQAAKTPAFTDKQLENIALLMRWIEKYHGVPRKSGPAFSSNPSSPNRLSGSAFDSFSGWLGHQHVPENSHWDPGAIDIKKLLA